MRSRAWEKSRPVSCSIAPNPVAQRVAVAVQRARRLLPVAVVLDERVQRAQQLVAVVALPLLHRPEHAAAVGDQRVVVLQRQQQLEGAEVLVGGDLGRRRRSAAARPPARSAPRGSSAAAMRRRDAAGRGRAPSPKRAASSLRILRASSIGSGPPPSSTAHSRPARIATRLGTLLALEQPFEQRRRQRSDPSAEREHRRPARRSRRAQPRLQLLRVEVAGQRLREHVADHVALQHFVALVQQLRERALGDRDERQLVRHLEQRELALARGRYERRRDALVGEALPSPAPRSGALPAGRSARAALSARRAGSPSSAAARPLSATASGRPARCCAPSARAPAPLLARRRASGPARRSGSRR